MCVATCAARSKLFIIYLFFVFREKRICERAAAILGRVYRDEKKHKRVPGCISPSRASRSAGSKREDTTLAGAVGIYDGVLYITGC